MKGPKSALLVDDEAHIRVYFKAILKQIGFEEFIEADDGQPAIELYREHRPDVVFLDINMRDMDGLETLKRIQEIDSDALVVMLTAQASRKYVEESGKEGAVQYLRKDTPKDEMVAILKATMAELFE